ncbi:MAG: methyl-accepting chemotaxis protein [Ramlibacter sp.]|nr:methyl-accepting chemotaxis protein [Ramlibacter sp.]
MKIWHKLLVAPLVAILFLLGVGIASVALLASQGMSLAELVRVRGAGITAVMAASRDMSQVHTGTYWLLMGAGDIPQDKARTLAAEHLRKVDETIGKMAEYRTLPFLLPAEQQHAEAILASQKTYRREVDKALQAALANGPDAKAAMNAADTAYQQSVKAVDALSDLEGVLARESAKEGAAAFKTTAGSFIACILLAILAALGITLAMARAIVRPLQAASAAAHDIAQGDLTTHIVVRGKDETADLLRAQSRMQQDLRRVVSEVLAGAHAMSRASSQIAQGNQELSQRTEMQASTLEETASSLEELTSTVRQNADNARQASQLAVDASHVARQGGEVMGQVVQRMAGISGSSRRISDIISVIDGIAFQTNILALNAAVEAARAGDQGRGFAVVAAEVRNLAQRSAAAAREIKTLIAESAVQVDAGAQLVDSAGATMTQIVASVNKVSSLIAEIAAASEEQSSGIGQVNTATTQMDLVVQQNAALVEEASAATAAMKARADALLQVVSRFRLGAEDAELLSHPEPRNEPGPSLSAPRIRPAVQSLPRIAQPLQASGAGGGWQQF